MDDWQLLRSYAGDDSQDAFTEIVRRHLNLVYSAASRQVRDPELARDVTQLVFANLARCAKSLKRKGTLAGWLYRDASFTSRDILRRERRRVAREQEAVAIQDIETSPDWQRIQPRLDAALSQLGQTDRDAILLRFFERRSLKEVGSTLGVEEDAARKRVSRALEKLRMLLAREGITTTDDALSGALTSHAVNVAPPGIATGIIAASLAAGSAAAATGTTTFIELFTMTTKLKATLAATVVLAGVGTPLFLQQQENKSLRAQNETLLSQTSQMAALEAENERLSSRIALAANNTLPDEQRIELNRLRGEVARLRAEANEAQQLRPGINRFPSVQQAAATDVDATSNPLLAFLGEAVPPPPNIDPAYTKEGLMNAVQQAAQLAGVVPKTIEIDTSEFPFLAGVVCDSDADFEKLKTQLKNLPGYEYMGGTSSHGGCAFNMTPYRSYPSDAGQRISRRSMLRCQVFFNQLTAR
jgi:RNA polymerase sigma factor (sigma-70 family)